jgi:hypothetical protein
MQTKNSTCFKSLSIKRFSGILQLRYYLSESPNILILQIQLYNVLWGEGVGIGGDLGG